MPYNDVFMYVKCATHRNAVHRTGGVRVVPLKSSTGVGSPLGRLHIVFWRDIAYDLNQGLISVKEIQWHR